MAASYLPPTTRELGERTVLSRGDELAGVPVVVRGAHFPGETVPVRLQRLSARALTLLRRRLAARDGSLVATLAWGDAPIASVLQVFSVGDHTAASAGGGGDELVLQGICRARLAVSSQSQVDGVLHLGGTIMDDDDAHVATRPAVRSASRWPDVPAGMLHSGPLPAALCGRGLSVEMAASRAFAAAAACNLTPAPTPGSQPWRVHGTAQQASWWLARTMPCGAAQRWALLACQSTMVRLRTMTYLLSHGAVLVCRSCRRPLCSLSDVASLQGAGVSDCFVNPHGIPFRVTTAMRVIGDAVAVSNVPPTHSDSWFRGFGWTMAHCRGCDAHLGWRYDYLGEPDAATPFTAASRFEVDSGSGASFVVRPARHMAAPASAGGDGGTAAAAGAAAGGESDGEGELPLQAEMLDALAGAGIDAGTAALHWLLAQIGAPASEPPARVPLASLVPAPPAGIPAYFYGLCDEAVRMQLVLPAEATDEAAADSSGWVLGTRRMGRNDGARA